MFAQISYALKTHFLAQKQEFFPVSWSLLTPYSSGNIKNELCGPKIIELGPGVTYDQFSNQAIFHIGFSQREFSADFRPVCPPA